MNKLLTNFNGGYPIELDDLRFRDEAYRTAITNLVSSFATHAVLTGCDSFEIAQTGLTTINSGWVVIDGEVGYLPTTVGLDQYIEYAIIADNTVDSTVVKVLQSGVSVNPNEIRQFKIEQWHPNMNPASKLWQMKQMKDVLKQNLGIVTPPSRPVIANNTPTSFVWSVVNNRWEAVMLHEIPNPMFKIQSVNILFWFISQQVLMPLPSQFSYIITNTEIIITDNSAQVSNDDWRALIINNGLKITFQIT